MADISDDLRYLLADGYVYQKKPDDGEYYVTIRQFQGYHGDENPFFENLWLARLATNANSRNLFDQLSKHKKFSAAFDALLDIPGLFGGFRLSTIHQLLGMKCDEVMGPNLLSIGANTHVGVAKSCLLKAYPQMVAWYLRW